jgi:quercetin dioxygenase-like cupin family protein
MVARWMVQIASVWIASSAIFLSAVIASAQTATPGVAKPDLKQGLVKALADVKFAGDDTKCLRSATENGDPDTGPSTLILKAAPGCKVPWHFHTAEEQLIVTQGSVQAEMDGMAAATLNAGGFAMMPSKVKHRFSCQSKTECVMFVTFDRKYDIVWVKDSSPPANPAK